jgi:hypothetical protein
MRQALKLITILSLGAFTLRASNLSAGQDPWVDYQHLEELLLDDPLAALETIEKTRALIPPEQNPKAAMVLKQPPLPKKTG